MSDSHDLDEAERDLMLYLGIRVVASQLHADPRSCADALDVFAERGESQLEWTATDAWLRVAGKVIVHAARDWLHWMAHRPDPTLN